MAKKKSASELTPKQLEFFEPRSLQALRLAQYNNAVGHKPCGSIEEYLQTMTKPQQPTQTISSEVENLFKSLSGLSDNLSHLRDKLSPFLKDAEPAPTAPTVPSQATSIAPTNNCNIMIKLLEMGQFVSEMQRRVSDMTNRVQD